MKILVTGATRGIGRAIVERIANNDAHHLFCTARTAKTLKLLRSKIESTSNSTVEILAADLANGMDTAKKLASWVSEISENLDLLVLNGGFFVEGELSDISEADYRRNMEVNCNSSIFLCQSLLPLLRKSDAPRIVIIGSTAAYEPYPLVPSYGIAKWALRSFAINLRKELAPQGISVTFLSPGATWTTMWEGEDLPADRLLEADDIAKMLEVLLSLSKQAVVEEIIMRPMLGDIHE